MITTPSQRPEDRQRGAAAVPPPPDWADTVPACFRSEAFAEDLPDDDSADVGVTVGVLAD